MPGNFRRHLSGAATVFTALLAFLLPLKFGGLAVMPESGGFYPDDIFSWLYITFPPHALGIAGALLLSAAMSVIPQKISRRMILFILFWSMLPPVAAIPGAIRGHASETLGEIANLAGMGTFSAAAALLIAENKKRGILFAGMFFAGALLCAGYGIYQHFAGLDELREFAAEQMRKGVEIPLALQLKMADPRIFSTMASSNALASLLLLLLPLSLWFAFLWGGYFTPEKVSRRFFAVIFLGITGGALFLTSSRSAIFCPAAAAVVALLSYPGIKKYLRLTALVLLLAIITGSLFWVIRFGRGTASMVERVDYVRTAAIITAEHPCAGGGWGSFFRTHMQVKFSNTDEAARDPHNVIAAFTAQAGIFAGLAMTAVLLLPLAMLWRYRFTPGLPMAVFWCGVLFTLHSLLDCDWHIPALPAAMGMLYAAAIAEVTPENAPHLSGTAWKYFLPLPIVLVLISLRFNIEYLRGDHALAQLNDRISPASVETAQKNRHLDVKTLADKLITIRPADAIPWILLGNHYAMMQDLDNAKKCYEKARALDPGRPGSWAKLAYIARLQNDEEQAEKLMLRAHQIFPKNPRYDLQKFIEAGKK